MSSSEHPDRPPVPKAKVRKATCRKCGACETKPAVTGVCELQAIQPWVGPCFNGVFVKGDGRVRNPGVGRRSKV